MDLNIDPGTQLKAPDCNCGVFGPRFVAKNRQILPDPSNPRLLQFDNFDILENGMELNEEDGGIDPNAAIDAFLDFLLNSGSRETKTYCFSHNGGKFDMHVILERMYAKGLAPKLTMTGNF